jgi:DeoR family transcriptional regulator, aga operon transcriptional repressor
MEATLNQQMIRSAQRVIVLADSSKFGRRGFSRICGLSEIDMIITDDEASPAFVKNLEEAGVEVIIR